MKQPIQTLPNPEKPEPNRLCDGAPPLPHGRGSEGVTDPLPHGRGSEGVTDPLPHGRGSEGVTDPLPHGRGSEGVTGPLPHGRGSEGVTDPLPHGRGSEGVTGPLPHGRGSEGVTGPLPHGRGSEGVTGPLPLPCRLSGCLAPNVSEGIKRSRQPPAGGRTFSELHRLACVRQNHGRGSEKRYRAATVRERSRSNVSSDSIEI